jgi:pimeloyl-ACP methyl ester carboxylesterase
MTGLQHPLVLLRGLNRDKRYWLEFTAEFTQCEALWIDLPGMAVGDERKTPFSVARMVEEVRQELQSQGHSGPYHLLGFSLGGMVVLEWLRRYPAEVLSLSAMNTSSRSLIPNPPARVNIFNWTHITLALLWHRLRTLSRTLPMPLLVDKLTVVKDAERREHLIQTWTRLEAEHSAGNRDVLAQLVAAMMWRVRLPAESASKVQILQGSKDRFVPPRASQRLHKRLPGSTLHSLPGGHELTESHGAEVAAALIAHALSLDTAPIAHSTLNESSEEE